MKAVCTKNPEHKKFWTTAHVMEEWLVDAEGNFLEKTETLETTHEPDPGNTWTCAECKAPATVQS